MIRGQATGNESINFADIVQQFGSTNDQRGAAKLNEKLQERLNQRKKHAAEGGNVQRVSSLVATRKAADDILHDFDSVSQLDGGERALNKSHRSTSQILNQKLTSMNSTLNQKKNPRDASEPKILYHMGPGGSFEEETFYRRNVKEYPDFGSPDKKTMVSDASKSQSGFH